MKPSYIGTFLQTFYNDDSYERTHTEAMEATTTLVLAFLLSDWCHAYCLLNHLQKIII